jgi:hypothetical protein
MRSTARTVLPTDLVALVSWDGRIYSNEAMTRDRMGTQASPHPLETAFEQWFSFATGRHTWISVKGATLRGLVSARKRGTTLAWEVDCLIDAAEDDPGVLMSLLDQLTAAAGRSGALKVFLRLPAASNRLRAAARCGFTTYVRERVYHRAADASQRQPLPEGLRRRAKTDAYPLFQLYNAAVPSEVRRVEAATLVEWAAAQESLGRASHHVFERDGRIAGAVRIARDGDIGRFDALYVQDPAPLLATALTKLSDRSTMHAIVPAYQEGLAGLLEAHGFEPGEEYDVLSRRTVRPVKVTKATPAIVQTTFG